MHIHVHVHNANSKGTTPRKSAQLLQEQERNTQSADRTVSSFVDSSAQHRENEAEPDSNGNKNFQSGPNLPCQSAQTDKSVSSALTCQFEHSGKVSSDLIGNFYFHCYQVRPHFLCAALTSPQRTKQFCPQIEHVHVHVHIHTLERDEKRFFCNSEFHGFNRSSDSNLTTIFRR